MKQYLTLSLLFITLTTTAQLSYRVEHALLKNVYIPDDPAPVYKIKPAVDFPVALAGTAWTLYAFTKVYNKDASTIQQIQNLRVADINGFDRWGADIYSEKAAEVSDLFFFGSMPVPLLLLADKHVRGDIAKVGLLYLEAMAITGTLYSSATTFVDRYRPYAYNPEASMDMRRRGGAKNSFFAGHAALVGTSTFFAAKVFSDYHPDSKLRYVFWGAAIAATGTTGYLRHRGGRHFPSDVLLGTTIGTLSGILVPHFHKTKIFKNQNITLVPFSGQSHGLAAVYHIK